MVGLSGNVLGLPVGEADLREPCAAGYLYDDFSSGHDYDLVVNYARELGALLLELPKARKVFVTADGHLQIR